MSRPLRISYPNAWYHVMDRSIGQRALFTDSTCYNLFLGLCAAISHTYDVEIHAYCLLKTEFHLLLRTPRANLSAAMRQLLSQYTTKYNQLSEHEGPLFKSRYKAILVEDDSHILQVSRHIHRLPGSRHLVPVNSLYKWSSYPAYIGQRKPPSWLHRSAVRSFLANHNGSALYRIYVETEKDPETEKFYNRQRLAPVLGSRQFVTRTARLTDPEDKELADARMLTARPSIEQIVTTVADYFATDKERITTSARGRYSKNTPRAIAISLCRHAGGHSLKQIAQAFGVSHYSSVTACISRLQQRLTQDCTLKDQLDALTRKLHR